MIVPVLINALHDPHNDVRLVAAKSLNWVAPDAAVAAGVVPMLVEIPKDPNDQIAYRAAESASARRMTTNANKGRSCRSILTEAN